jgi:hypothetical protein
MRMKIKIKSKLEGIKKKYIGGLNWKEKNFNKKKKKSKEWRLNWKKNNINFNKRAKEKNHK